MGDKPLRKGLRGAESTPKWAPSEPQGEAWEAHHPGPAWSECIRHSRPRGHQAE